MIARFAPGTTDLPGAATADNLDDYFEVTGDVPGVPHVSVVTEGGFDKLTLAFTPANRAPTFESGDGFELTAADANVPKSLTGWAYAINPGTGESGQNVTFTIDRLWGDPNLFTGDELAVAPNGTMTFTWTGFAGSAIFSVTAFDDGGTDFGGVDISYPHYLHVTSTASGGLTFVPELTGPGDLIIADRGPYLGTEKILAVRGPDSLVGSPGTQRLLSTALNDPYGIAANSSFGEIYVADYETVSPGSAGGIYRLIPSTLELELLAKDVDFITPFDLVVDQFDGYIYVADLDTFTTGAIFRVDPVDGTVTLVSQTSDFFWLRGITLDSFGCVCGSSVLYVSDSGDPLSLDPDKSAPKIFQIDLSNTMPIAPTIVSKNGNLSNPDGLYFDNSTADLFVAEANNQMILNVALPSGVQTIVSDNTMFSNEYIRPTHVTASTCNCYLYVTDARIGAASGERRVYQVDRSSGEVTILSQDGLFDQPRGLVELP